MNAVVLAAIGALTGLHAATWGGFKDSPFEGLRPASFVRSLGLGVASSVLVWFSGAGSADFLVAVGLVYATERLVTEWWKAILREDAQAAYSIPMRLAVHGRPVDARVPRYAAGVAIAGGLVLSLVIVARLQDDLHWLPRWGLVVAVGAGGWLTAVGGAWKDAPVEGFQLAKFFRSPVVATTWGCLLLPFTSSLPLLVLAAGGWSVITIETYKTFLAGGPPGKFAGKPIRFDAGRPRAVCGLVHALLYAVLGGAVSVHLLHDRAAVSAAVGLSRDAVLIIVLVWASAFGVLVLETVKSATVGASQGSGHAEPPGRQGEAVIRRASSGARSAAGASRGGGVGESADGGAGRTTWHRQDGAGAGLHRHPWTGLRPGGLG
jgi:hypothetical protein